MTRKRMNILIALVALVLYLGGICYQYTRAIAYVGNDFIEETNIVHSTIDSLFYNDTEEREQYSLEYITFRLNEATTHWSINRVDKSYPKAFGVYDETGKLVAKNGYYIKINNEIFVDIDSYITEDREDKFVSTFPKSEATAVEISKLSYYTDSNGKTIPTTVEFFNLNDQKTRLIINLNKAKGDEITLYSRYGNDEIDTNEYCEMDFYVDNFYRDKWNKQKQEKLNQMILDAENAIEINDKGEVLFDGFSSSDWSGGCDYSGSESTDYKYLIATKNGNYAIKVVSEYARPYCALKSYEFQNGAQYLTILFSVVMLVVFVVANKLYKKNEALNQARQTFTSAAAHELKTPITIINNQCECLLENVAPEKAQEYITNIYNQNKHISSLVNNLLQYNRIDSASLEKTETNLKSIFFEELEKYEALIESKELKITTNNIEDISIIADEKLIRLVIDNYISNAIKHTENGHSIDIACSSKRFSVFNIGSQIPAEDKNKIWEIFSRSVDNEVIESSGMGLAICKKILISHKFKYGFNNKNNGVEFYFEY